jgi:antitoxin (DNA-binding transcriptional repressor) of toxin-antitoxin stability system
MSTRLVSVAQLADRMPELLAALAGGERVQVTADGQVVAELIRPTATSASGPAAAEAAVAAIVHDMIADGCPPAADSPLWRFVSRAA